MRDILKNEDLEWNNFFDDLFRPVVFDKRAMAMRTDIKEDENQYELDIDMPGYKKSEIDVSLKDGYLNVSAKKCECSNGKHNDQNNENCKCDDNCKCDEKHDESHDRKNKYIKRERFTSMSRSYYVGDKISEKDIKAKYEDGVLSLVIPKSKPKEADAHKINID